MVDIGVDEITGVMACSAIDATISSVSMNCRVCDPPGSSRYMIPIMAGFARLCFFVNNVVIENTAKIEGVRVMTHFAIVASNRMILSLVFADRSYVIMTDDTAIYDAAVVEGDCLKIIRDMTNTAVTVGIYMTNMFTRGHCAIVTSIATRRDACVIKTTVSFQRDKTGRVVTVIAFYSCLDVMV